MPRVMAIGRGLECYRNAGLEDDSAQPIPQVSCHLSGSQQLLDLPGVLAGVRNIQAYRG